MKQKLLLFFLISIAASTVAQDYDFTATATTGQVLKYKITATNEVQLVGWENEMSGNLVIPGQVVNNTTTYSVTSIMSQIFYPWFYPNTLTSVTLPNTVTTVSYNLFLFNKTLETVVLPNSITRIDHGAFHGCVKLRNINIPNSVTSIGHMAFSNCCAILPLNVPNSVTQIEETSFDFVNDVVYHGTATGAPWGAKAINGYLSNGIVYSDASKTTIVGVGSINSKLIIPASVTYVKDTAFWGAFFVDTLVFLGGTPPALGENNVFGGDEYEYYIRYYIPVYVTCDSWLSYMTSGWNRFSNIYCPGVGNEFVYADLAKTILKRYKGVSSDVVVPSTVITIADSAFYNRTTMTSLTIPSSVTSIGSRAFLGCSNLENITSLANVPPTMGSNCFSEVPQSLIVNVPCGKVSIYRNTPGWAGLSNITSADTCEVLEFEAVAPSGQTLRYIVNDDGVSVTLVGQQWSNIMELIIPDSVVYNGITYAVTVIGSNAFSNSRLIYPLSIPNTIVRIEDYAFSSSMIIELTIPGSVTEIHAPAFVNNPVLGSITVSPDNHVYDSRDNCNAIIETATNRLITGIGQTTIPPTVTSIGEMAFYYQSFSGRIPASITYIGNRAFYGSSPSSFTSYSQIPPILGDSVFNNTDFTPLYVPCNAMDTYRSANGWGDFSVIQALDLLENIAPTGQSLNYTKNEDGNTLVLTGYNGSLSSMLVIPDSVMCCDTQYCVSSIGEFAFSWNWDLTNVIIGRGINTIGAYAFSNSTSLSSVTSLNEIPPSLGNNVFDGVSSNCILYVPCGSRTLYQSAVGWNNFTNIQERCIPLSITVNSFNETMGVATGGGTYFASDVFCISATENYGYHFTQWDDEFFNNPRLIRVTQDSIFTAYFAKNNYNIALSVDTTIHGDVSGGGTYEYLDTIIIEATANDGYRFKQWNDGDTSNPRIIILTQDTTFTALYDIDNYTIALSVDTSIHGNVIGGGAYPEGSVVTIEAVPAPCYYFTSWSDGDTVNPRTITLISDTSLTAFFAAQPAATGSDSAIACDNYSWHGTIFAASGIYTFDTITMGGCDSIITLNLTVNQSTSFSETITVCDSFEWHGNTYTTSSNPIYGTTNALGCDSIVTLNLIVNHSTASTETVIACDSYEWYGTTYTSSCAPTYNITNVMGCDSTVTLNLTVNYSAVSTETVTACDNYIWYGNTYTNSNATDTVVLSTIAGCDSIVTLNLTINHSTTGSEMVVACDSYTWHGTTYTDTGSPSFSTTNAAGCDSTVTLNLTVNHSTATTERVIACDSHTWHGNTYTASSSPTYSTTNAAGCDSTVTLNLMINHSTASTETVTACDSFTWHGVVYNISNDTDTVMLTNIAGCDSIVTLNLTVNYSTIGDTSVTACDSYSWHGNTYSTSRTPTYTTTNTAGCDSVATLNLTINHSNTGIDSITACNSYVWHGTEYNTSTDTPTFTSINSTGCDSVTTLNLTIIECSVMEVVACDNYEWHGQTYTTSNTYVYGTDTLILTVNHSSTSIENIVACDSYTWHGTTYTASGSPTYSTINAYGCDSTVTLNLIVNYSTTGNETVAACDSYTWHGNIYTTSGSPTFSTTNAAGCDSTVTLNLTVNHSTASTETVTACDSYTWHGVVYNISNDTDTMMLTNMAGCDSIVTLNLTVNYNTISYTSVTACDSYSWHGNTYSTSGTPTYTTTNTAGCDSVVTLNLTIYYSTTGDTIVAADDSFDWYEHVFLIESGNYNHTFVGANQNGCDSVVTLHLIIDCWANLPYNENFNSYTGNATGTTAPTGYPNITLPNCWEFLNMSATTSTYPQAFLTSSPTYAVDGNAFFFKSSNTTPLYAILPEFNLPYDNIQLTFTYRNEGSSTANGIITVGYMTDPTAPSTFSSYSTCERTTAKTVKEVVFPADLLYNGARIAFAYYGGTANNYYAAIDDITVNVAPSCVKVQNLNIIEGNTTENSIVLDWDDYINFNPITYSVYIVSPEGNTLVADNITTDYYLVPNLTPNTAYTFGVVANCSAEDASEMAIVSGRTACGMIESLPYTMGFEVEDLQSNNTNAERLPWCWTRYASGTGSYTYYPYSTSGNAYNGSSRSLYFYGSTTSSYPDTMMAILPELNTQFYPMGANRVTFYAKMGSATNSKFVYVGAMTNPSDMSTLTIVDSVLVSGNTYERYIVKMTTAETTATGAYAAVMVKKGTGNMYIDDLTLEEAPTCLDVTAMSIVGTTNNSITVSWTHNEPNTGAVTYSVYNGEALVASNIAETTYTVTGLTGNTDYTIGVVVNCANTDSPMVTVMGHTECDLMTTLPYSYGFEGATTGGSTNAVFNAECWKRLNNGTQYFGYPFISSSATYCHTGERGTYWSVNTTAGTYGDYIVAVLPGVDATVYPINNLRLKFWAKASNTTARDFLVGVMIDPSDISTFETVATVNVNSNEWVEYTTNLINYTGNGQYVAIRQNRGTASYYTYIDDITLEEMPTCLEVSNLVATTISNSITLTWTDENNTGATYTVSDTTGVIASGITSTTYTVAGLDAQTDYTFYVVANCSATDASYPVSVTVTTDCASEQLPFTEDFGATLASNPCWRGANNATAAEVFAGTALNLVNPTRWTYTSSERDGLGAGHYYKNVYGNNQKAWMITPVIDLTNVASAQLSFDVALTKYNNAALPDLNGDTNTSQAFMVIVSTDGGNTWSASNATVWQNVTGDYSYASLASTTYQNKIIDLTPYIGNTVKIAFYTQSLWSGGDNDLHIDNIAVTEGYANICQPVSNVTVANVNANSITVNFTTSSAPSYDVHVYHGQEDIMVTTTTGIATVTGLQPNTTYYVRVQAHCDSTTWSTLSEIVEVTTASSIVLTLGVNDATMGTTNPVSGIYTFSVGDTTNIAAIANTCYHFINWTNAAGNIISTNSNITLVAISDTLIIANFEPNIYTGIETTTACDSYTWHGVNYTASGTQTYSTTNVAGCDSTVTLNLTVNHSTASTETVTVCDSYTWHGNTYTTSSSPTFSTTNAAGCDSTVTLNLTVNHSTASTETVTVCDSYTWHGNTYTTSNSPTFSTTNAAGCDSTATLNLTINYSTTSAETETACDNYTWHGVNYTASGTQTYSTTNASGCDSTVILNLTINYSSTGSETATACDNYTWHGTTYTASGTPTYITTNSDGCDSTVRLNLTINYSTHNTDVETVCDSILWNNIVYTESGDYTYNYSNDVGCASVDTLRLIVNLSFQITIDTTVEDGIEWHEVYYGESGNYTWVGATVEGCDSTITLHLTVVPSEGIADITVREVSIVITGGSIVVESVDGSALPAVRVYDAVGYPIAATVDNNGAVCRIEIPTSGVYLVKVGDYPTRKVVVIK